MPPAKSSRQTGSSRKQSRPASSRYTPPDPAKRWRPRSRRGRICRYTFDGKVCHRRGPHHCEPRADRAVSFFGEVLVHTKGLFARHAFVLEPWQEFEIVRPLFGEVWWSTEWETYVRRYTVAGICLGRKNGKSELAAGVALLLLIGDDEEAAEVYGAAKTTGQARKVWEPARRMSQLALPLRRRLSVNQHSRRIYDEQSASGYEIITSDAESELGANPHGFILDELLSQRDGSLWDAIVTAEGTRHQPLFLWISTETNRPTSWSASTIDEFERIEEDPARAPHVFAYIRKLPKDDAELARVHRIYKGHPHLPVSCDPFDEANWRWPNPALGAFKSYDSMRKRALEAHNEPEKLNAFLQFHCNRRVQQVTRWMPLDLWDASAGMVDEAALEGRPCWAGLDLASTSDLTAWVLWFPPDDPEADEPSQVLWRFWTPEAQVPHLDEHLGGKLTTWARQGYIAVTEGDWIDYWGDPETGVSVNAVDGVPDLLAIAPQIEADAKRYRIRGVGYDQREATALAQHMQDLGLDILPIYQGFGLSPALKEMMRLTKAQLLEHGGHPVARWNADSVEIKQDDQERIKVVKPQRHNSGARIDGFAALGNAIRCSQIGVTPRKVPRVL